jgi:uncharacterized phiE125 gp8 family phage protein
MYSYPYSYGCAPIQIPSPTVIVQPFTEPVTLAEAKTQLRIDFTDLDTPIGNMIRGGRQWVEKQTGLALVDQTLEMLLQGYPNDDVIRLTPPVITVVSFEYTDDNGAYQTHSAGAYVLDTAGKFPRILPAYGVTWSATLAQTNSLRVRWRAGFVEDGSPTQSITLVPEPLRQAILLHVQAMHERENMAVLLETAELLCQPYRVNFGLA